MSKQFRKYADKQAPVLLQTPMLYVSHHVALFTGKEEEEEREKSMYHTCQ